MAPARGLIDETTRRWAGLASSLIQHQVDPELASHVCSAIEQSDTSDQIGRHLTEDVCGTLAVLECARKLVAASLEGGFDDHAPCHVALLYEAALAARTALCDELLKSAAKVA